MRPYLALAALVLMAAAAFGQPPFPVPGACVYGCGPYVPRLTTPEMHFQQFSPNPVGATNATTGLIAGATNSTLSQINGSTSSVYSVAVWDRGGDAPFMTRDINLEPEQINRDGRAIHEPPIHEPMFHEPMFAGRPPERGPEARGWEERARLEPPNEERPGEFRRDGRREERGEASEGQTEAAHADWIFITGPSPSAEAVPSGKAGRVYTNADVTRQNDKNGEVKYDSKTEKI